MPGILRAQEFVGPLRLGIFVQLAQQVALFEPGLEDQVMARIVRGILSHQRDHFLDQVVGLLEVLAPGAPSRSASRAAWK